MIDISESYFEWLCNIVMPNPRAYNDYSNLLQILYNIKYTPRIGMDSNRESDGIDLRYRFGKAFRLFPLTNYEIDTYLGDRPCSILEMMVALSIRMEESIMSDPDKGDRTSLWFYNMLCNVGLRNQTNYSIDIVQIDSIIHNFLIGSFDYNGQGSLFTTENPNINMRDIDLWGQMNIYVLEYDELEREGFV